MPTSKNLHKNVNQYTKSGIAPSQAVGRGETAVGISFMHDLMIAKVGGFPGHAGHAVRRHRL